MGFRKQGSITAAALLVLALPGTASAHDYCVNRDGCVPVRTFDATGLQAAFEAAGSHVNSGGDPDRVLIGPGQYVAPGTDGFVYFSADPVELVGGGSDSGGTRLVSAVPGGSNRNLLVLAGGPHVVRNLSIEVPGGSNNLGLGMQGLVVDVKISGMPSTAGSRGIYGIGTTFVSRTQIDLPASPPAPGPFPLVNIGIGSNSIPSLIVRDSTITAHAGIASGANDTAIYRVRINGLQGVNVGGATAAVYSSLLRVTGNGIGIHGLAHGSNLNLQVSGVTIVGSGPGEPTGISAEADTAGHNAFANVTGTLIREVDHPLEARTNNASASANVWAEYSDFLPAGNRTLGTGTQSVGTGGGIRTSGDDPRFVATTGPDAYRLRHDSPLVDSGEPWAPVASEAQWDLALAERVVNGDGAGDARRDIGAFEYGRNAPRVVDNSFPASGSTGEPFTFDATGSSDADPGEALTYSWTWDDGSPASSGARVTHAFATPGEHTATVTVTDPAGVATTATRTVTVTQAPPVSPAPGGDSAGAPQPQPQAAPPGSGTAPAQPGLSGLGFSFGAVKAAKLGSSDLVVTLKNTSTSSYVVSVGTTEREPTGRRPKTIRFGPVKRTLQPGATTTLVLKAPKTLATKLKRQGTRKGQVVRRPRITVTNLTTGSSNTYAPKVVSRWRKGGTR